MTNYYVELGLDRSASIEELEQKLKALKKQWVSRASSAATTEKRQHAERMVELVREASENLLVKDKKAKYDKELDKNPAAASAQPTTQQQPTVNVDASNVAGAALLDLVEQFYDTSNYNQAIAVAKKALETGNESVQLYRILALCYAERGDDSGAFNTLQQMIRRYDDDVDAHFNYANLCLRVLDGHTKDARKSIDWLLQNGYEDDGQVVALDIEYELDNGDKNLADKKINEYLSHHSNDKEFRQSICRAIAQYADVNMSTGYGGDDYFDTEEDFKGWLALYERALEIYPDSSVRKVYDANKELASKVFLKENWMGILCCAMYIIMGFASPEAAIIGIVALILTIGMIIFSFVPKWMLLRFQYTKHLVGLYEVFRIINYIASLLLRFSWWCFKLIWRILDIFF